MYRVVNLHLAVDAMTRLLTDNPAIDVCDRFLGEPTTLYTSLYYERGSEQSLHRDTPVFCTSPGERYMGVWTALDAVDESNGPCAWFRAATCCRPSMCRHCDAKSSATARSAPCRRRAGPPIRMRWRASAKTLA